MRSPHRRGSRRRAALALTTLLGAMLASTGAASAFAPGAASGGDPFFPSIGNGGYDVADYSLRLRYRPQGREVRATATISAVATEDLSRFNLDYAGPRVRSVRVGGADAAFERLGRELVVTPAAGIAAPTAFEVRVAYAGRPGPITDPDGSKEGWFHTTDGAFVVGEPLGSLAWYPSNNIPTDKATFTVAATVPRGLKAISNGDLVEVRKRGGRATFTWSADEPMSTYLATLAIGRFRLERDRVAGIRSITAVDPRLAADSAPALRRSARILRLFKRLFGPYPFTETGAIVDKAGFVGYALETQTRPIYPGAPDEILLAHELSHQWYGNSVGLEVWPDIWLNEGFATWAEWRWDEESGGPTTAKRFAEALAAPASRGDLWNPPPAIPGGPEELFAHSVYERGAMALEALRQQIGDPDFYEVMRAWAANYRHANATTAEFIALAEATSGQQLDALFETWLYRPGKPTS